MWCDVVRCRGTDAGLMCGMGAMGRDVARCGAMWCDVVRCRGTDAEPIAIDYSVDGLFLNK